MSLIEVAVRRPVTVAMGAVTLLLFGVLALLDLPVNLLPELSYPSLTVRTEYEGAAPAEIEALISKPIEQSIGVVKNVRSVKSISRPGQSDVILHFNWGTDMDMAGLDVREKLEVLQLPLQATRPLLLRFNPATAPIMRLALSMDSDAADEALQLKTLRRYADETLQRNLEPVSGVAAVKISGGLEDEVQIDVDLDRLTQLGLDLGALNARLLAENMNVSAGRLEDDNQRYLVRTINQFSSMQDIGSMVISTAGDRPVRLRDVASVVQGHHERDAVIRVDGLEAIEIAVYKEGDANTVRVAAAVHAVRARNNDMLPAGMRLQVVDDQSRFITASIRQVVSAALLGGVLAMAVIFVFLRSLVPTIIIGLSIPISIVATFFLMNRAGVGLNIMSLGGIALAAGLLVDNAIVVLENIARQRRRHPGSAHAAAIAGTRQVAAAVVAATLTTMAVFVPLAFVEGVAGELFRDQALTVSFALAVSLLVAMTLIPMLAGRLSGSSGATTADHGGHELHWLRQRYAALLHRALQQRLPILAAALLLLGAAGFYLAQQKLELIPQLAQGRYEITLELSPGSPLRDTDAMIRQLQRISDELPEIEFTYAVSGSGNRIDANPTAAGENIGRLLVVQQAGGSDSEQHSMAALRQAIAQLPGVSASFTRPQLLSIDKPVEVEIAGYDLADLKRAADLVEQHISSLPMLVDIESSMARGHPEIQIVFDQQRAAALGLTVDEMTQRIVRSVRGEVATRYSWRDRKIDVLVRASEHQRTSMADIRKLVINPGSSRPLTLDAVATVTSVEGPAEIRRSDQQRVAVIAANLASGPLGAAIDALESRLQSVQLPAGTSVAIRGQNEELQASSRSLLFALALAIFLVYMVMAAQFESLLQPLIVLFSIPLAAIGVAIAVLMTGMPLSVMALIGLIMLAGIVVNNAIVLIDLVNQLRAQGAAVTAALIEAGEQRLRPILMTTLTTILGLLPMAIGFGEGAELRSPMALTVISGLLLSMLLTLLIIPLLYSLFAGATANSAASSLTTQTATV